MSTIIGLIGLALLVAAGGLIAPPLGLVVAGGACLFVAHRLGREGR